MRVYLDHQATTPVDSRVLEAMLPYFREIFGNASSRDHIFGLEAREAVENARQKIANMLNARPDEIIFTSGATESNNLAIRGVAEKLGDKGRHIITSSIEHKAVLETCHYLEKHGFEVTYLPVDSQGFVDPDDVRRSIRPDTILISVMTANNEVGTIEPIEEIGRIAEEKGILFHTDATQAFGYVPLDVKRMHIHLLSLSGHKIYGPKGIGVLYRRRSNPRASLEPLIRGGGHERGLRSGTLNVPGIVGMAKAMEIMLKEASQWREKFRGWCKELFEGLREVHEGVELNGPPLSQETRLPHNLNVYLPGVESRALIVALKDVAVSTGSACTTERVEPSHVLMALFGQEKRGHQSIRISVGKSNDDNQILYASKRLKQVVSQLNQKG